ncbi:MAG TPA: alpha/beta hydrolase [Rhizomicrobium sp.]|nr:alpha/beta hydrolase [Rhizomicrobium sp.]
MTTVYFATNRQKDGTGPFGFGAQLVAQDPQQMTYGVMAVTNIDLKDEASGSPSNPTDVAYGNFSATSQADIINAGKNLLIFIHGFDNTFVDAIKRAAYNQNWFAAGGPQADTTIIAFTWPSAGVVIDQPPHLLTDAYKMDQAQAGKSGFHIAQFLARIDALQRAFRSAHPGGRVFLLAHSMGNWALQAGIQTWFESRGSNDLMFDQVFLAAADEIDTTFEQPADARLSCLPKITKQVSIYYSRSDIIMWVSATINLNQRLGFDGPDDKSDTTLYPPAKFRCFDCSEIYDYDHLKTFDASHQYYRRSVTVRNDIVAHM